MVVFDAAKVCVSSASHATDIKQALRLLLSLKYSTKCKVTNHMHQWSISVINTGELYDLRPSQKYR